MKRRRIAIIISVLLTASPALASPYCLPKADGIDRIARTRSCPTGYFASGNCCEALHKDTPKAFPKVKGASCPSGTFASGDNCKTFR